MEKELANENMNREKELKKLYNSLAQENDSEAICHIIETLIISG